MSAQEPLPQSSTPSHPGLIQTVFNQGDFTSYVASLVSLPPGALFATFEHATKVPEATYATVQTGEHGHMLLNSDLLYVNHSCRPNLEFDVDKMEVRVSRDREIRVGDKMTFFYPSTEWDMSQPFECVCQENECLGTIRGAKYMDRAKLSGYWLNKHIQELLQRDSSQS